MRKISLGTVDLVRWFGVLVAMSVAVFLVCKPFYTTRADVGHVATFSILLRELSGFSKKYQMSKSEDWLGTSKCRGQPLG